MIEFSPFPKIGRLSQKGLITEKIDGTNAQIYLSPLSEEQAGEPSPNIVSIVGDMVIYAGSRNRWVTPGKDTDNYGFARWVKDNSEELVKLGPGQHFGEWYGSGIGRTYGLDHKRFALFNTLRWRNDNPPPVCCSVVPVLYYGELKDDTVTNLMHNMSVDGSRAVPGFSNPEGVIVYYAGSRTMFKRTFDDRHKEAA